MCMFCAAIPVAGAVGAKINADQNRNHGNESETQKKPIVAITTGVIVFLFLGSVTYHTIVYS